MADNSSRRKKALIISMLAFLFIGGGIFLFFIMQGSDDLTGSGVKNSFTYGFSVREAVMPLFKSLGVSTYEDELVAATKKRLEARGIDLSPETSAPADVSDWMAPRGAGAGKTPGPSPRKGAAAVPVMALRGGAAAGGSGGSTNSSREVSRFGAGPASGNVVISAKAKSGAGGPAGKSTLGALTNARALLGEGLRSGSALTASSKWGQGFGSGSGGSKPANLSYSSPGLVKLDKIESGEIPDLKMDEKGSLKIAKVSPPGNSEEEVAKAQEKNELSQKAQENKMKLETAKAVMDAAAKAFTSGLSGDSSQKPVEKSDPTKPPEDIAKVGSNSTPPDGKYCPSGCALAGGGFYADNDPDYKKEGDTWTVTYTGTQTLEDGTVIPYADKMAVVPGGNPPLQPLESYSNGQQIPFGGI
jgi:hypothetical protein